MPKMVVLNPIYKKVVDSRWFYFLEPRDSPPVLTLEIPFIALFLLEGFWESKEQINPSS